jgi:hypothetical protein
VSCERWLGVALVFEYNEYKSTAGRENEEAPGGGRMPARVDSKYVVDFCIRPNDEGAEVAIFA